MSNAEQCSREVGWQPHRNTDPLENIRQKQNTESEAEKALLERERVCVYVCV